MSPRVRHSLVAGGVIAAVAAGVATFVITSSSGASATETVRSACTDLARAFRTPGDDVGATVRRSSDAAQAAARKDHQYRTFATSLARLAGPSPAPGVGVVAPPSDLTTVQATCTGGVVPRNDAIAVRAPYLTDVTADSALVNFATDKPFATATVNYGDAANGCHFDHVASTNRSHAVTVGPRTDYLSTIRLTNLNAGSRYCYQLGGGVFELSTLETSPAFSTAASPSDTRAFSFAVIGDFGAGTSDEANVLRQIASSPAAFITTVGDNAYEDGTQANYGDLSGGNVFGPEYWPQVGESRPTFAAQGNHGFSNFQAGLTNWPQPSVASASGGRSRRDFYCCISTLTREHAYPSVWYAFDWDRRGSTCSMGRGPTKPATTPATSSHTGTEACRDVRRAAPSWRGSEPIWPPTRLQH